MTTMQLDLLLPHEVSGADREMWNTSLLADPVLASPFLSFEWAQLVHRHRPSTRILRVAQNDAGPVSFLALDLVDGRGVAVGAGLSDRQAIVGSELNYLDARAVLKRCRVNSLRLDQVISTPAALRPYVRASRSAPLIDTGSGADAYFAELKQRGSGLEKWLQRKSRMAERELGSCRFEHGTVDREGLDRLMALKSAQYNRTGVPDRFAEQWVRTLAIELSSLAEPPLAGVFSVMYANDTAIAFHLGVRSESVVHWWMPTYDPTLGRYSPGALLLADLVRYVAGLGIGEIDLGHGEESYKRRFMTTERFLDDVRMQIPSMRQRFGALRRVYRRP